MSSFERYLTLWVAACIVVGIGLGHVFPGTFRLIGSAEIAKVNLPVAALIWLMIIPMLLKIDFAALGQVRRHWRGIGVTLFVNWAVKPFSMALLGWFFIGYLFRAIPAGRADRLLHRRAHPAGRGPMHGDGLRLEQPVRGRAAFHAVAGGAQRRDHGGRLRAHRRPAAGAVFHHSCRGTRCCCPLAVHRRAGAHRAALAAGCCSRGGPERLAGHFAAAGSCVSLVALLVTLVLLFGFQGEQILRAATGDRAAGRADPHPGLFQFRARLPAEPQPREKRIASPDPRR
jgi:ACR3 family arsenite transporter